MGAAALSSLAAVAKGLIEGGHPQALERFCFLSLPLNMSQEPFVNANAQKLSSSDLYGCMLPGFSAANHSLPRFKPILDDVQERLI